MHGTRPQERVWMQVVTLLKPDALRARMEAAVLHAWCTAIRWRRPTVRQHTSPGRRWYFRMPPQLLAMSLPYPVALRVNKPSPARRVHRQGVSMHAGTAQGHLQPRRHACMCMHAHTCSCGKTCACVEAPALQGRQQSGV
jgi:hypothetical protein